MWRTEEPGGARDAATGVATSSLLLLFALLAAIDWVVEYAALPDVVAPVKVVAAAGIFWFATRVIGLSSAEMGVARRDARRGLVVGSLAAGVIVLVLAILILVPSARAHFTTSRVAHDTSAARWLEPLVVIPLGTALFEEFLFRGVLLGACLRRWSTRSAVLVTSLSFGLWHVPVVLQDLGADGPGRAAGVLAGTVLVTSAAGALFAVLRLRSRSLIAPVLAHTATNAGAYVAALVAIRTWG